MDPLATLISFGPAAVYLLLLAGMNLRRRPTVISGGKDIALLAMAVMGMVAVGPLPLLVPDVAAQQGLLLWGMLLAFYLLCVSLLLLVMRPRIVIYNISQEDLMPVLTQITQQLDPEVQWAGESAALPQLNIRFYVDAYGPMRNVSLVSLGDKLSYSGWQLLRSRLRQELAKQKTSINPRAFTFATLAIILLAWPSYRLLIENHQALESLRQFFRR